MPLWLFRAWHTAKDRRAVMVDEKKPDCYVVAVSPRFSHGRIEFLLQWAKSLSPRWRRMPPQISCFAGGRKEGETDLDALVREVREESYLQIDPRYTPELVSSHEIAPLERPGVELKVFLVPSVYLIGEPRKEWITDNDRELRDIRHYDWHDVVSIHGSDSRLVVKSHMQGMADVEEGYRTGRFKRYA